MTKKIVDEKMPECTKMLIGIRDTKDLLSGKWKTSIIAALIYKGKLRFMDLLREVDGIAPKMLSKELQELEMNQLITRTVLNTKPITVEYEITEHGLTLKKLLTEMANWGLQHRSQLFKKEVMMLEQ